MPGRSLTILFSGMIAGDPGQGGATWAVLQYILGLQQLGHEVHFIEPLKQASLQPMGVALAGSANASYFTRVVSEFGLAANATLLLEGTTDTVGVPYATVASISRRADLLINISGMLTDAELVGPPAIGVYLDLDPTFVQLWSAVQGIDMRFDSHTHFVTVGQNIGRPGCTVPTCGRVWIPTSQPIVLNYWHDASKEPPTYDALTTIANWRGYGSVDHEGTLYGQKAHSLRQIINLPMRTTENFSLAILIHPAETSDLEALRANGWNLRNPSDVAGTPDKYQRFVRGSKAEFGIAKSGYVASQCGWFSDRSVCYLASGRPVIAQDTGFCTWLSTGEGLLTFRTADDVLAAIDAINTDYVRHSQAARQLAEDVFDSNRVLTNLLQKLGVAP